MKDYVVSIDDADMALCIYQVDEIYYYRHPDFCYEVTVFSRNGSDLCFIPSCKISSIEVIDYEN